MSGFRLAPSATAADYRMEAFDEIGSTNAEALARARTGDAGPLWLVSDLQTAGRGRRGRQWQTQRGNLAATLLLGGLPDLKAAATLGFAAGLALFDALDAVTDAPIAMAADGGGARGQGRFALKWPNDVLAQGAKLSGILLESTALGPTDFAIAVGMGVNVVSHPDDLPYPATSLAALGSRADAATLFLALSDAWTRHMAVWNGGRGIARIRQSWLERAAGLGSEVAVEVDGRVRRGVFETIDEDCRFVIRDSSGERVVITAGDVHFGAVATRKTG